MCIRDRTSSTPKCAANSFARLEVVENLAVPLPLPSGMVSSIRKTASGLARETSPDQCPSGSRTSILIWFTIISQWVCLIVP